MTSDFEPKLIKHFEDDANNFGKQNAKIDKLGEQMAQNGEHLSYFSKHLLEIKNMVQEQTEINKTQSIRLEAHIARVEPMISSYESDKKFNETLNNKVMKWGKRAIWLSTLLAALYYIKSFIIKVLLNQ